MASFSITCPKSSAFSASSVSQPNQNQLVQHRFISVPRSDPRSKSTSLLAQFQGLSRSQNAVFKVCSQLNEVGVEKLSNSEPVTETKSDDTSIGPAIPDASSISAFMTKVSDILKLVDSRDVVELQLKQMDCELLIRKKEALEQISFSAPVPAQPPIHHSSPPQLPSHNVSTPVGPASMAPASVPAQTTPEKPKSSHPPLKCPMAGIFYRSPAPGAPPFVKVGDKVQKGQVVCIIEAMKLMNEIEADQSGTIVEILADDAKPVSVDTPLLVIEP